MLVADDLEVLILVVEQGIGLTDLDGRVRVGLAAQLLKELACLSSFGSVHTKLKGVTVLSIFNQRGSPPFMAKFSEEKAALLPLSDSR